MSGYQYFNAVLFHSTLTPYVIYSDLRSDETICLQIWPGSSLRVERGLD